MKHVFVETNWVVEYGAPAHLRLTAALTLAQRAAAGDLRLYIPSVCLTEARHPIRKKFNPRSSANSVRSYLDWASTEGTLKARDIDTVRRGLDKYETTVLAELNRLEERLGLLRSHPGIEVFPLSEEMLVRAVELSIQNLDLRPFDQAILAAVLVRAQALRNLGADDISLCELDGDLQPWDKTGRSKQPLSALYDAAGVWVYGDFAMENPPKRPGFPEQ
jgi:predicted nucleic acid-binding protein